jgi:glycosyltransferase involved in cell wall biosynthesis
MSRLSVVIPVYQYADACLACLASLVKQTRLPDEIVIVDDGSTDGLKEKIVPLLGTFPVSLRFFRFEQNKGAPAARNEGARQTTGDYIIFLDPDTELAPIFLEHFERVLEEHPEIDFVYSAYNFGWNFSFVPFSAERLKQTNFIHMNSLLRRSAFPGFDESLKKFQDWDLWLTMVERGSKAIGIPEVLFDVSPRATGYSQWVPSFMYNLPWDKLGWAPKAIKKYRLGETIIRKKHQLPATRMMQNEALPLYLKTVLLPLCAIVGIELLSFLVIFHPEMNTLVCLAFGLIMLVYAALRPTAALALLLTEYVIGSKGALFKAFGNDQNNGGVSVRIVLFGAFFLGWFVNWLRAGQWKSWRTFFQGRGEYLVLGLVLVWAFMQGLIQKNAFVFADANAWGFLLLLIPVLDLARRATSEELQKIGTWIAAALLWIAAKTLILFYLFSHTFPAWFLEPIYLWVRRTGVGEITRAGGNVFRVFFQSHIYALLLLPGFLLVQRFKKSRLALVLVGFSTLFLAQTIVSLSRSFFLGLVIAGLAACIFVWREERTKGVVKLGGRFVGTLVAAGMLLAVACFFPIPRSSSSLLDAWQSRIDTADDASASRWKLLPAMWEKIKEQPLLGSGFGATVTYVSRDPRVVQSTGGVYTTYAFEWGWLEHWIKFGILGIPLLLFVLVRLARRILASQLPKEQKQVLVLSLIALAAVHISTPYLNHPLGFAWLVALEGMAERFQTR